MKKINKFARDVAAIDNKMLKACPQKDKIWATQVGYALMLTFVVLFGITFYSMTIMHGGDILFDTETKSIKFDTQVIGVGEHAIYAVVSMIVSLVVVLFDRAFYQSDWFMQAPYGVEVGFLKRVGFFLVNLVKITIRIVISLFLAYTFSSFLELKVYESELLTSMQKKHLEENKVLYSNMDNYEHTLAMEEEALKVEEKELLQKLETLNSGVILWQDDKTVTSYDAKKHTIAEGMQKEFSSVSKALSSKSTALKSERKPLERTLDVKQKEYNELELQYQAEVGGLKEIEVNGKVIKASGIPTEGRIAKVYKKRMGQIEKEMEVLRSKVNLLNSEIIKSEQALVNEKRKLQKSVQSELQKIDEDIVAYKTRSEKNLKQNATTTKSKLELQLQRVQERLDDIVQNKQRYVEEHYKGVMNSPEFIPFRDGPMSRLIAMEEMKQNPNIGEEIAHFSWIVKGILIFLEIAPILAKMLFAPATVYATALQMQTKRATQRIVEEDGMTIYEIDELIALEKKKRELIKEKQDTKMKELFHTTYQYNLKDIMRENEEQQTA